MQFLGLASVVALIGVAGIGAASTLRDRTPDVAATSEGAVAPAETKAAAPAITPAAPAPQVVLAATPVAPAPDSATTPVAAPRNSARGGFVLVEGRTQLTDSIYAVRAGDSVIVNFDTQGNRTRRSDKFERSLRATLPLVYGRMATAALDTLKDGHLVTNRDVIGALANGGMQLHLGNGAIVRVRALTRVGRDGPLAVGYLTTIER